MVLLFHTSCLIKSYLSIELYQFLNGKLICVFKCHKKDKQHSLSTSFCKYPTTYLLTSHSILHCHADIWNERPTDLFVDTGQQRWSMQADKQLTDQSEQLLRPSGLSLPPRPVTIDSLSSDLDDEVIRSHSPDMRQQQQHKHLRSMPGMQLPSCHISLR